MFNLDNKAVKYSWRDFINSDFLAFKLILIFYVLVNLSCTLWI